MLLKRSGFVSFVKNMKKSTSKNIRKTKNASAVNKVRKVLIMLRNLLAPMQLQMLEMHLKLPNDILQTSQELTTEYFRDILNSNRK